MLCSHSGNCHAKQIKQTWKVRQKMKPNLGRLYRDIQRKLPEELVEDLGFQHLGELVERAMSQTSTSKNKLDSVQETHIECINKGKAGDRTNAFLLVCGYNLRPIYRHIVYIFILLYLVSKNYKISNETAFSEKDQLKNGLV